MILAIIILLCLVGMGLSGLALFEHIALAAGISSGLGFCNISASVNCAPVLTSYWSQFLGIPLGTYGLIFHLVMLLVSVATMGGKLISKRTAADFLLLTSFLGTLVSLLLFGISKFIIGTLCPICLGTYATEVLLLVFTWKLGSEVSFSSRILEALQSIFSFPKVIFGLGNFAGSNAAAVGRMLFLAFLLGLSAIWFFPDFVINRFLAVEAQKQQVLRKWSREPVTKFALDFSGALNGDFAKGPSDAPIQIVEFSDFQCPACRNTYEMMEKISKDYKQKIFLVHKNYPLDKACNRYIDRDFHKNACFASEIARCAGEQGKFWVMADLLYRLDELENGENQVEAKEAVYSTAASMGMDRAGLEECLVSKRHLPKIQKDIEEAEALKIAGTPSIWLNGRRFEFLSEEALRAAFQSLIAGK